MILSWLRATNQRQSTFTPRRRRPGGHLWAFLPRLEGLEQRLAPATFMVRSTDDSGRGSLRQAVLDSNRLAGEDNTIAFAVSGTISLASALPRLDSNIDMQGPGATQLTVQRSREVGTPEFRIFSVAADRTVILTGLTIANGRVGSMERGGGINNEGTLTVSASILSGNMVEPPGDGGGVTNLGVLTVTGSLFRGNSSRHGGAIDNAGTLTISGSTFDRNTAGAGSGVFNTGVASITSSTFTGNVSRHIGTVLNAADAALTVSHCTFSGNFALKGSGGGINNDGTANVTSSTISHNEAFIGGGIYTEPNRVTTVYNTIIAANSAALAPDVGELLDSRGHNLIGNGLGGSGYADTDLVGTLDRPIDPWLGPLQDNGGPTWTRALLPRSPAMDAGDNTDAPEFDQRGPGYPRVVNGVIDIGAFEAKARPRPERFAVRALGAGEATVQVLFTGPQGRGVTVSAGAQPLSPGANPAALRDPMVASVDRVFGSRSGEQLRLALPQSEHAWSRPFDLGALDGSYVGIEE